MRVRGLPLLVLGAVPVLHREQGPFPAAIDLHALAPRARALSRSLSLRARALDHFVSVTPSGEL